eukprot:gnl/TRDRNA2_/TRDRNA2_140404_c0_seq2.p1 gnl/TRDRNA2_/TRDRNA2_140404_c0~~gnl/TRDRNA2_/TRDRNA2_140404_c0_seq2.p1  ORF type:complete len:261 (+),score=42.51 gnl/TRDRNA2_/TRDRNA2_140404_c0_seq2:69-851(+)
MAARTLLKHSSLQDSSELQVAGEASALKISAPVANDDYFSNEPGLMDAYSSEQGVIATFDFDYDLIIDFETKLKWAQLLLFPPFWLSALCGVPCFLRKNIEWNTRAQHVALTIDGIKYVKERHPSLWGFSCNDIGKESKTVPYDAITDCDVQEPAGTACCCFIPKVLSTVRIDTASSGGSREGIPHHELELHGLVHANEFKRAVWSMKRGAVPPNAVVPMDAPGRNMLQVPKQGDMNTTILLEIRDELRELNALMRASAS